MWCIGLIWATHRIGVCNSGKQKSNAVVVEEKVPPLCTYRVTSQKKETKFCLRELQLAWRAITLKNRKGVEQEK